MPADFRTAYAKFIAATWQDPSIVRQLKANPGQVLKKYGLPAPPAGSKVDVQVVKPTGNGSSESQMAAFKAAAQSKTLTIWLPVPPAGPAWSRVGGATIASAAKLKAAEGNSCCCTPCCCCT